MLGVGQLGALQSVVLPRHAASAAHASSVYCAQHSKLARWLTSCRKAGQHLTASEKRNSPLSSLRNSRSGSPALACASGLFSTGASSLPTSSAPRICILGGGFGGLYTAVKLQSLMWPNGGRPQVTLVDKGDRFVFKPLLYEIVSGTAPMEEVAPPFVKLLTPYNVNFIQGGVKAIEPFEMSDSRSLTGGRVLLDEGSSLEYDWLVLSLGAESNTLGVPGAREFAVVFNTIQDALKVQQNVGLLAQRAGSEVVVVGSGPAGVELSVTVAERLQKKARVHLISTGPEILKGLPGPHRAAAESVLQRKGVQVVRNSKVQKISSGSQTGPTGALRRLVEIEDKAGYKRDLQADLVLWTAGSQPMSAAESSLKLPFPLNDKGAMKTDDTLRIVGHPRVFALGDLAGPASETQLLASAPATAQVAFQQADYAAWNIWSAIHHRPLLPFKYQHLGDMMSLGSTDGAVTLPITLPAELTSALRSGPFGSFLQVAGIRLGAVEEKGVTLEGGLGALIRRAAYLYRQPTNEQRLEVGSKWLQGALDATNRTLQGRRA